MATLHVSAFRSRRPERTRTFAPGRPFDGRQRPVMRRGGGRRRARDARQGDRSVRRGASGRRQRGLGLEAAAAASDVAVDQWISLRLAGQGSGKAAPGQSQHAR